MPWPRLFPEDFLEESRRKVKHPLDLQHSYACRMLMLGLFAIMAMGVILPVSALPGNSIFYGVMAMLALFGGALLFCSPNLRGRLVANTYEGIVSAAEVAEVAGALGWEVRYNKKDLAVGFYNGRYQEFYTLWAPYGLVEFIVEVVPGIQFICTREEIPRCEELFRGIATLQEIRRVGLGAEVSA